jgi:hypothetical protein
MSRRPLRRLKGVHKRGVGLAGPAHPFPEQAMLAPTHRRP